MKEQLYVVKRDGTLAKFDEQKIIDAIFAAFYEIDGDINDYASQKAYNIATYVRTVAESSEKNLEISDIQKLVEHGLMSLKRKDIATAYIEYRSEKDRERLKKTTLIESVGKKLMAQNIENQNANVDELSFGGRKGEATNALTSQYALDYVMSKMSRDNHINNMIYIHDRDSYAVGMHNCLTIPFDMLLKNGFTTRQVDIRPANSVNTAFQLLAVIFQLQSLQQFGGVSAGHLDWTMVSYVRKSFVKHLKDGMKYIDNEDNLRFVDIYGNEIDKNNIDWSGKEIGIERERFGCSDAAYNYAMTMTEREVNQAVEGMYHNLNSLQSRSGN